MSVSNETNKVRYDGDGTTVNFDFSFKVFTNTDIEVYVIDTTTDPDTPALQTLTTNYTVTLNTVSEGGTVTMNTAPAVTDDLLIVRVLEYTQPTVIPTESNIPETQLENTYDKNTMLIQQVKEITDRSAKVPQTSDAVVTLPDPISGKALLWSGTSGTIINSTDDFNNIVTDAEAAQTAAELAQSLAETAQTGAETAEALAQEWATNTSSIVEATDYSSKEWATGSQTRGDANGGSAKDWANYTGGTVDNVEFSAKKYAQDAAQSAIDAANASSSSLWTDVVYVTNADSPVSIADADSGKLYVADASGGAITFNLPAISGLTLDAPWAVGVQKSDAGANDLTVNRNGTDVIDGANTSETIGAQGSGITFIPDEDATPDSWTTIGFGRVPTDGLLVGTTDTQTLTNKTFDDEITLQEIATPSNPGSGYKKLYPKSDGLLYTLDSNGVEIPVGTGSGGGLDVFYTNAHENANGVGDYTSGNNATFDNGGTLDGTLANEETTEINGSRSISYTHGSGSTNDWIKGEVITLKPKQQDRICKVTFYAQYDGNDNDNRAVIWDDTNNASLLNINIIATAEPKRYEGLFYIPASCASLAFGIQTVTGNSGNELIFDEIEFSTNTAKGLAVEENHFAAIFDGSAGAGVSLVSSNNNSFLAASPVSRSGTGVFTITWATGFFSEIPVVQVHTLNTGGTFADIADIVSLSTTSMTINIEDANGFSGNDQDFYITVSRVGADYKDPQEGFIFATDIPENVFSAFVTNDGTATVNSESSDFIASATRSGAGVVDIVWNTGVFSVTPVVLATSWDSGSIQVEVENISTTGCTVNSYTTSPVALSDRDFTILVQRQAADYKNLSTSIIALAPKVAIIEDQKSNGTNAGSSVSASVVTRDLNTVSGDSSILSLSTNQFTLGAGKYFVEFSAPGLLCDEHHAYLYNITDSSVEKYGSASVSATTITAATNSVGSHVLNLTTAKTFEIRQYTTTVRASDGLGRAVSSGGVEIYTQVKITKLA